MFCQWLQQLLIEAVQVGHPQHMSLLGVINPEHITDNVRNLSRQIVGYEGESVKYPPNPSLMPILADALQDAGVTDEPFLQSLRDPASSNNNERRQDVIRALAQLDSWNSPKETQSRWKQHVKDYREQQLYEKVHKAVVGKNSILPLGYIEKIEHDLRGTPPPGVIWYRNDYNFRVRRRRFTKYVPYSEKHGRRLSRNELQQIAKERQEVKRKNRTPPPSGLSSGLSESVPPLPFDYGSYSHPNRHDEPLLVYSPRKPRNEIVRDCIRPNHLWTGTDWGAWIYSSSPRPRSLSKAWKGGGVVFFGQLVNSASVVMAHVRCDEDGLLAITRWAGTIYAPEFSEALRCVRVDSSSPHSGALAAILDAIQEGDLPAPTSVMPDYIRPVCSMPLVWSKLES